MKQKFLLLGLIAMISMSSFAQKKVRLNALANYVFDDQIDSYYDNNSFYDGKITGGLQWGLSAELMPHPGVGIELSYLRQDTKAPTTYYDNDAIIPGPKTTNFDMGIGWLMLGGNRYLRKPGSKLEGFAGLMMGAVFFNVKNPDKDESKSATKFGWGLKGGANIWVSESLAIKLQAQLMSAVQSVGGGLYVGTGGAGVGVSSYSSMLQFGLGGGLAYEFGNKKEENTSQPLPPPPSQTQPQQPQPQPQPKP